MKTPETSLLPSVTTMKRELLSTFRLMVIPKLLCLIFTWGGGANFQPYLKYITNCVNTLNRKIALIEKNYKNPS